MGGYLKSLFGFKSLLMWAILGCVLYFGWPIIEAIIIVLPIPDPMGLKQSIANKCSNIFALFKSLPAAVKGSSAGNSSKPMTETAGYKQDFETEPNSLMDDDDDEEDIGRSNANKLDYNSDEKEEAV